jgi:hypothetical protein
MVILIFCTAIHDLFQIRLPSFRLVDFSSKFTIKNGPASADPFQLATTHPSFKHRMPAALSVDRKAGVVVDLALAGEKAHIQRAAGVFHLELEGLVVVIQALFTGIDQFGHHGPTTGAFLYWLPLVPTAM